MTVVRRVAATLALATVLVAPAAWGQQETSDPVGTYFLQDTLNPGLGPRPESLDLSTPQGAVETFLDLTDADDPAAAHVLDLGAIEPDRQTGEGPELARQLRIVLSQQNLVSWRQLMERPDSLDSRQSSNAALAGEPRRSILLGILDLGERETAVRLNRVRVGDTPPVWVFSERTVSKVPDLYDEYGPSRLEREMPGWLSDKTILGLKTWELIGLPIIFAGAWVAGWITWRIFKRIRRNKEGYWERVIYRALRWPITIAVVTTVVLVSALKVFTVSGVVATVLTPLTIIGYTVAILIFALSVIDTLLDRIVTFDSDRLADPDNSTIRNMATLMTAGRRVLIVIALLVAAGVVLASANVFRSLGFSLLASAGALTLVLGFAARQVLGNMLASLQIALNRSARIGDQLVYEGMFCTVERIHFTFVQLKTWNGNRKIVPVSHFVSDSFENWSMVDGSTIWHSELTLAQEADIDAMREKFLEICENDDRVSPKERCRVIVVGQDAFGQKVRFESPIPDPNDGWLGECEIREATLAAARKLEEETGRPFLPKGAYDDPAG